jgi:hypothetical protein
MAEVLETVEDVQRYLAEAFGPEAEFTVYPSEFGWVCREVIPDDDPEAGFGLGNYVVNRATGVVTAHASLHPLMIAEMYDNDIRSARPIQGYQVYPPTWEMEVERVSETPTEVQYRVRGVSLQVPPEEPPVENLLTIDKETYRYRTDAENIHVTCTHNVSWAQSRLQRDGTWPEGARLQA